MILKSRLARTLVVGVMGVAAGLLIGCGPKKPAMGKTDEGLVLEYRIPTGTPLRYETSQNVTQQMEVMGQSAGTEMYKNLAFAIESQGLEGDNYQVTITIEAMDASLTIPQGDVEADTDPVVGESFDMKISRWGNEIDLSGSDSITYSMGMAGTRSIRPDFEAIFPDLPGKPVEIGGTWTTRDTINIKEDNMDVSITSDNLNTLEGFETVDGRECARVSVVVTGGIAGAGMQGGANVSLEGEVEGTEVWFFAYDDGLFIRSSSDLSIVGAVKVTGMQEMTIPMTQEMKLETSLIE